jgi:hypothetical protein
MIFFAVAFLAVLLAVFAGALSLVYKLFKGTRYQLAAHAWVVAFLLEMLVLAFVKEQALPRFGLTVHNALYYVVALTVELRQVLPELFRGQHPDVALLLLLPGLPALAGFWLDRRRRRTQRYVCTPAGIHWLNGACVARWEDITRVEAAKVVGWHAYSAPTYHLWVRARGAVLHTNTSRERSAGYAELERGLRSYLPGFKPEWQELVDQRFAQMNGWNEVFAALYHKDKVVVYTRA